MTGNHDITLDTSFYQQHGLYFHNQDPQDPSKCQALLAKSSSVLWLRHGSAIVNLTAADGPRTSFKIFGSPYSPAQGVWAFGYAPEEAAYLWDQIPLDADIVVTHTPPKYHCDERKDRRAAGCEVLRRTLWRVRPRLAVCGHIHEGRGAEIVNWDLSVSNNKNKEEGVDRWTDPGAGNKKLSLVDLTGRHWRKLRNDGGRGDELGFIANKGPKELPSFEGESVPDAGVDDRRSIASGVSKVAKKLFALPIERSTPAMVGQGGYPPSRRSDIEALAGRMGRRQTCVVNAAITANSWPHRREGRKVFNKPIVVDIDLPMWSDETTAERAELTTEAFTRLMASAESP